MQPFDNDDLDILFYGAIIQHVEDAIKDAIIRLEDKNISHPFILPELILHVGNYLDTRSLKRCIFVCRAWYKTLLPYLWSSLEIRTVKSRWRNPSITDIHNHAMHIRKLSLCKDNLSDIVDHLFCPNLVDFSVHFGRAYYVKDMRASIFRFIAIHQSSLTSLSISIHEDPWENIGSQAENYSSAIVMGCSKLRQLRVVAPIIRDVDIWLSIYEGFSRLQTLSLTGAWFPDPQVLPNKVAQILSRPLLEPSKIQDLTIQGREWNGLASKAHLWFIQHSFPSLVRLCWMPRVSTDEYSPMHLLALAVRAKTTSTISTTLSTFLTSSTQTNNLMPRLESLNLSESPFEAEDFATVLQSLQSSPLTEIILCGTNFNQDAWTTLKEASPGLLQTLRVLDVNECQELFGFTIQEIMCSTPNLQVLRASSSILNETDLENENRPWVCKSLRILEVPYYRHFESNVGSYATILDRLSELVCLEDLRLGNEIDRHAVVYSALPLTLCSGLDRLRNLRRLRILQVSTTTVWWTRAEIRWVVENWPELRVVDGFIISVEDATDLLNGRRILIEKLTSNIL